MSEDRFFERLRADAQPLRYEADDVVYTRIAARVRERVARPQTSVSQLLATWFRPVGFALGVLSLVASLSLAWTEMHDTTSLDSMSASSSYEIAMGGEHYSVGD